MIRNIYILLIFISYNIFSQTTLKGTVIDSKTNQVVPFVSVVLENPVTKQILDYTQSDDKGFFNLTQKLKKGVYQLTTRHLSYQKNIQTLVISETNTTNKLIIKLNEKQNSLEEIIIKASKPILIKKDTIIYDVKSFSKQKQQTLEEVLGDMDGIRVLPNGEIEVKGKQVRKVLVNGKEVADVGASILTKSLDAKQVKKIEVRFDEKSKKLKESLLETKKYVVLDITLKNNINTDFFGKIRLTNSYQNDYKLGYYTNLFSLKEKQNLHLFSEYDKLGTQTISLKHIKHIGQEAFAKIFEIPADFKSLTEKEMYHSEVFNFDDFITYNRGIIGISFLKEINPNWQLFFGSYNSFSENEKHKNVQQLFNNFTNNFNTTNNIIDVSSKNKLEFKYHSDNTKFTLNTNLVYSKNNFKEHSQQNLNSYKFIKKGTNLNLYNNLSFEYTITKKLGFEVKMNNSYMDKNQNIGFSHNDISIFKNINQINKGSHFFNTLKSGFQLFSKIGVVRLGVNYNNSQFEYQAQEQDLPSFSQAKELYKSIKENIYFDHLIDFGNITISNKLSYGKLSYLTKNKNFFDYKGVLSYNPNNNFSISGFYENKLSSFPLTKLTKANNIINFNTIEIPAIELKPTKEQIISFELYKSFNSLKLDTDFAFISGKTFNQNSFYYTNSLILSQRNQLFSEYQAYSFSFNKKFKRFEFKLEPEALFNSVQNSYNNKLYKTQTARWFLGLKIKGKTTKKGFNYYLYPKYTKFKFSNDLSNKTYEQKFLSLAFNTDLVLLKNKLFVDTAIRKVYFFDIKSEGFLNLDIKLSGKFNKLNWFLIASNILNNSQVIQKNIQPLFMNIQQNNLFERYIKFGLEYKF